MPLDMSVGDEGMPDMLAMVACATAAECMSASTPSCKMNVCSGCTSGDNTDCMKFSATPFCGTAGGCVECLMNADCAGKAATPFCGPMNTCVACLKESDCSPQVCATDNVCRGCQKNSECGSGVCAYASGNCVPSTDIYLVDNGGEDPFGLRPGASHKERQHVSNHVLRHQRSTPNTGAATTSSLSATAPALRIHRSPS